MLASSLPTKFTYPFGANATSGYIRPIPVTSSDPTAASQSLGFPPATGTPTGAGGTPPNIQDENGVLNQATSWDQWFSIGGPIPFDPTLPAAIGGYPKGAIVASATTFGVWWLSTDDNNTTNPDTGGSGWEQLSFLGGSTGDIKPRADTNAQPGWVIANATTVGNAASNATQRANADTFNLFSYLWTNFSNTQCPVFTSGGSPTTRGVSAAADYAANKAIQVLDLRGTSLIGVDTMQGGGTSRLFGVPVNAGGTTVPGSSFGENEHILTVQELALHAHGVSDPTHTHASAINAAGSNVGGGGTPIMYQNGSYGTTASATGITINNIGNNFGHNTVQLTMGVTWLLKL